MKSHLLVIHRIRLNINDNSNSTASVNIGFNVRDSEEKFLLVVM